MNKFVMASVAVLLSFLVQAEVTAGTITFDDFTTDVSHVNFIPEGANGYAGVEWFVENGSITRARWTVMATEYLGSLSGAHSGNYVAHIAYGAPTFGLIFPEAVNFNGAWFSNSFSDADGVIAVGYRKGQEVARTDEVAFYNASDWVHLGALLENIDQVAFFVRQTAYSNRADVLIDDISFTKLDHDVPEPASLLLFLLGAGCLAASRRKNQGRVSDILPSTGS